MSEIEIVESLIELFETFGEIALSAYTSTEMAEISAYLDELEREASA